MLMSSVALWQPLYLQQLVLQTARVICCLPVNTVFVHVFVWHTHLTLKICFFIIQYLIICTEITNTTLIFEMCPPLPCSLYCHCNIFPVFILHSLEKFLFSFNSSQESACISIISRVLSAAASFACFYCSLLAFLVTGGVKLILEQTFASFSLSDVLETIADLIWAP